MSATIALFAAIVFQADTPRPPRPLDEDLTAAVQAERSASRILSQTFRDSNRGGVRIGCGLIETEGHVEPFSVVAAWKEPSAYVISVNGVTRPPEIAHWAVSVSTPSRSDYDDDGDIDRTDRNYDVLKRRMAKMWCDDLEPPAGVVWALDPEPHPDPARDARARALAERATDLLLGRERGTAGGEAPRR